MDARKSRDSWKILKPATASSEATASYSRDVNSSRAARIRQ
jgi:hypothetical protein